MCGLNLCIVREYANSSAIICLYIKNIEINTGPGPNMLYLAVWTFNYEEEEEDMIPEWQNFLKVYITSHLNK